MLLRTDYDKRQFDVDGYGNLYPKPKQIRHRRPKTYKGYTIDVCVGHVKVWDESDNFFGEFPDVKSAKRAIRVAKSDNHLEMKSVERPIILDADPDVPETSWRLIEVSDKDWTQDTSGVYTLIYFAFGKARIDVMSDNHEPIMSFIGAPENVRKHVIQFLSDKYSGFSHEHASYIGRELAMAENLRERYVQDVGIPSEELSDLYLSRCPDTGRVFLCQAKADNNLAEVLDVERWKEKRLPGFADVILDANGCDEDGNRREY